MTSNIISNLPHLHADSADTTQSIPVEHTSISSTTSELDHDVASLSLKVDKLLGLVTLYHGRVSSETASMSSHSSHNKNSNQFVLRIGDMAPSATLTASLSSNPGATAFKPDFDIHSPPEEEIGSFGDLEKIHTMIADEMDSVDGALLAHTSAHYDTLIAIHNYSFRHKNDLKVMHPKLEIIASEIRHEMEKQDQHRVAMAASLRNRSLQAPIAGCLEAINRSSEALSCIKELVKIVLATSDQASQQQPLKSENPDEIDDEEDNESYVETPILPILPNSTDPSAQISLLDRLVCSVKVFQESITTANSELLKHSARSQSQDLCPPFLGNWPLIQTLMQEFHSLVSMLQSPLDNLFVSFFQTQTRKSSTNEATLSALDTTILSAIISTFSVLGLHRRLEHLIAKKFFIPMFLKNMLESDSLESLLSSKSSYNVQDFQIQNFRLWSDLFLPIIRFVSSPLFQALLRSNLSCSQRLTAQFFSSTNKIDTFYSKDTEYESTLRSLWKEQEMELSTLSQSPSAASPCGFMFIAACIWAPVLALMLTTNSRSLFASGMPRLMRRNLDSLNIFKEALESQMSHLTEVLLLRQAPSTVNFMKKWNLSGYMAFHTKQVVEYFEAETSSLLKSAVKGPSWMQSIFNIFQQSLTRTWSQESVIAQQLHRTTKLSLQILVRFMRILELELLPSLQDLTSIMELLDLSSSISTWITSLLSSLTPPSLESESSDSGLKNGSYQNTNLNHWANARLLESHMIPIASFHLIKSVLLNTCHNQLESLKAAAHSKILVEINSSPAVNGFSNSVKGIAQLYRFIPTSLPSHPLPYVLEFGKTLLPLFSDSSVSDFKSSVSVSPDATSSIDTESSSSFLVNINELSLRSPAAQQALSSVIEATALSFLSTAKALLVTSEKTQAFINRQKNKTNINSPEPGAAGSSTQSTPIHTKESQIHHIQIWQTIIRTAFPAIPEDISRSPSILTDAEKIKLQLHFDVLQFIKLATKFGQDIESAPTLGSLWELVKEAPLCLAR